MPFFVYLSYNGQVHPQKWSWQHTVDGKDVATLQKVEISNRQFKRMSLQKLEQKFPYKPKEG